MRIALISDIHGNYPALKTVLDQIRRLDCQLIISLGDIAGYYCMLNECIELCRANNVINIVGNHDHYLLSGEKCLRSFSVNVCLDYQRSIIDRENLEWLECSIPMYRENDCWFVHGGWHDHLEEYVNVFDFDNLPDPAVKIYASGHTHIQKMLSHKGISYVNPGSVGQPRDGDPRAAYAIIDATGKPSLYREDYDIDRISSAMKSAGFEDRYYSGLYSGTGMKAYTK